MAVKFAAKWLLFLTLSVGIVSATHFLPVYVLAYAFALSGVTAWILTVLILMFSISLVWMLSRAYWAKTHARREINFGR